MHTKEKTVFQVVCCVEQTKNLLEKDLYIVKTMNSPTGSTIFKLKIIQDDTDQFFFFEQKTVHFTPTDVYCNGFLSDDKKNVGTIQLKFKPYTYCCP